MLCLEFPLLDLLNKHLLYGHFLWCWSFSEGWIHVWSLLKLTLLIVNSLYFLVRAHSIIVLIFVMSHSFNSIRLF